MANLDHSSSRPTSTLRQRTVEALLAELKQRPVDVLPSLAELSRRYRVSVPTMRRCLKDMETLGGIECSSGRRARVARRHWEEEAEYSPLGTDRSSDPKADGDKALWLAERIARGIGDGEFRAGNPLPKRAWFAGAHGISLPTVGRAFQWLVKQGLVSRQGRGWVAARLPAVGAPARAAAESTPIIVLVLRGEHTWRHFLGEERAGPFAQSVEAEAARFGVQLSPVLEREGRWFGAKVLPGGPDAADSLIRQAGPRYLGTLVAGGLRELPELLEQGSRWKRHGRPVVWFDRYGEGDALPHGLLRCHIDETAALHKALDCLEEAGHRHAIYIDTSPLSGSQADWIRKRGEALRRQAGERGDWLAVDIAGMGDDGWTAPGGTELREALHRLFLHAGTREVRVFLEERGMRLGQGTTDFALADYIARHADLVPWGLEVGSVDPHPVATQLLRMTPALLAATVNPTTTALIAPNDYLARRIFYWLLCQDLRIPEDFSLISFDNAPQARPLPITTVDFGFGSLGYMAFHALSGDIPVRRDRRGDIAGKALVIHRGSVGRPARKPPSAP